MDEYIIIDSWLKFIEKRIDDDIEMTLDNYKVEFNELFNVEEIVGDDELNENFYNLLSEIYCLEK